MEYVTNRTRAIDVGGHCGLWARNLVKNFNFVESFEPVADHRACFVKNAPTAKLHPYALGDKERRVAIHTQQGSSGDSWVDGPGEIEMRTLDSFAFIDVGLIKLDCEGYELFVLKGAVQTLRQWRPVVIVEQKPGRATKFGVPDTFAVDFLQAGGMKLQKEISGDYILTWD
jgi:FkbM family methyltransferase